MICRLRGVLLEKKPPRLVLETGGVAFLMEAPMTAIYDLPEPGESVTVYTVLRFRDDQPELFAFTQPAQQLLFTQLIKVSGIGPRMALAILSGLTVDRFLECMRSGDAAYLTTIPGVGRRTAERLLVELRDRIEDGEFAASGATPAGTAGHPVSDAVSALVALGYNARDAQRQVQASTTTGMDSEALIRAALKRFAKV